MQNSETYLKLYFVPRADEFLAVGFRKTVVLCVCQNVDVTFHVSGAINKQLGVRKLETNSKNLIFDQISNKTSSIALQQFVI